MYYVKYFTGNIDIILETFFIILVVLLLYWKRNDLYTGRKNHSTGKKNYSTWHLICRLFIIYPPSVSQPTGHEPLTADFPRVVESF